jgi:anaerobic ribonucleoside-triphosphate reductase
MADVQELPMDRAEVAARRDKDGLLDLLDERLEHYLHTLHEYQEVMQQLSKELSSVSVACLLFAKAFVLMG